MELGWGVGDGCERYHDEVGVDFDLVFLHEAGCLCVTVLPRVYFVALGMQVCFYLGSFGWRLHYSPWPDFFCCWLSWFENYHICHTCDNSSKSEEIFDLRIIQSSVQVREKSRKRIWAKGDSVWYCLFISQTMHFIRFD